MPLLGGEDAAILMRELCAKCGWNEPYIVCVTAGSLVSSAFNECLPKPVNVEKLQQIISRCFI